MRRKSAHSSDFHRAGAQTLLRFLATKDLNTGRGDEQFRTISGPSPHDHVHLARVHERICTIGFGRWRWARCGRVHRECDCNWHTHCTGTVQRGVPFCARAPCRRFAACCTARLLGFCGRACVPRTVGSNGLHSCQPPSVRQCDPTLASFRNGCIMHESSVGGGMYESCIYKKKCFRSFFLNVYII